MIPSGKCPKCEAPVRHLKLENIEAKVPFTSGGYNAITLQCPSCSTILSAAIDPIALKADIVKGVLKGLGR